MSFAYYFCMFLHCVSRFVEGWMSKIWLFLVTGFLQFDPPLSFFSAVHLLCCSGVHDVNCIKQGINAWGSGSLVIADGNTDQRPLTAPWVFGLLLSALLH